jgi:hypothetical protein
VGRNQPNLTHRRRKQGRQSRLLFAFAAKWALI